MWEYEKRLQFPVHIDHPDPKMARYILEQYGGPDGELGASVRYLSQRFAMPCETVKATLNDIGTEELAHLEMVGTIVRQLLKNATTDQIEAGGFAPYFLDHGQGIYPASAAGVPWSAAAIASGSDPIANLNEDLAAEQKARMVYDNILRLATDPQVIEPIRFLREREIVHYQRFGEALRIVQDQLTERRYY